MKLIAKYSDWKLFDLIDEINKNLPKINHLSVRELLAEINYARCNVPQNSPRPYIELGKFECSTNKKFYLNWENPKGSIIGKNMFERLKKDGRLEFYNPKNANILTIVINEDVSGFDLIRECKDTEHFELLEELNEHLEKNFILDDYLSH